MALLKTLFLCCVIGLGFKLEAAQFKISLNEDKYTLDFTVNKAEFSSFSEKKSVTRQPCNAVYLDSISSPFIRLYASEKEASNKLPKDSVITVTAPGNQEKRVPRNSALGRFILSLPALFSGAEVQSKWRCG